MVSYNLKTLPDTLLTEYKKRLPQGLRKFIEFSFSVITLLSIAILLIAIMGTLKIGSTH
jgi:hypothetical protein